MNHVYRLVWNQAAQRCVAAPETARGRGKSRAAKALAPMLLGAVLALPAWADAPAPGALPAGGQVVSGKARIGQNGAQMTIDQNSPKAILQWQGFDIGSGAKVQFNQPNASAVAHVGGMDQVGGLVGLNRAADVGLSDIDKSRATGKVTGVTQVDGLVGSNDAGGRVQISRSRASGLVSIVQGASDIGEQVRHTPGTIKNSQ